MKNPLLYLSALAALLVISCSEPEQPPVEKEPESLIEFKDGVYIEYYPGRKAIKFKGPKDENNQRDGIWYYYSESGVEQSMTEYSHGKRNGGSYARYPDGRMRYYGDWKDDKQVGIWVTYNPDGTIAEEKDYGQPE